MCTRKFRADDRCADLTNGNCDSGRELGNQRGSKCRRTERVNVNKASAVAVVSVSLNGVGVMMLLGLVLFDPMDVDQRRWISMIIVVVEMEQRRRK